MIGIFIVLVFNLLFYSDHVFAIDDDELPRVREANKEPEVLEYLKPYRESHRRLQQNRQKLKPLLIASFINASRASSKEIFYDNLERLHHIADFAAVLYYGSPVDIRNFCGIRALSPLIPIIYCRRAAISYSPDVKFIPKPVLYENLLPYLPHYRKILLIDEDISLSEFNATQFLNIWDCAFFPNYRPMIVQGLLAEPTQYFHFVHQQEWSLPNLTSVIASATDFIEQQIPAFDSLFLQWFIERVMPYTYYTSLLYRSDWGADSIWCFAARAFAHHVYGVKDGSDYVPCALITGTNPFHHLNTKALVEVKSDEAYQTRGDLAAEAWENLFPLWKVDQADPNLIDPTKNSTNYRKAYELNRHCPLRQYHKKQEY